MATVLITSDYKMAIFNSPRQSKHKLVKSQELNGKVWGRLSGYIPGASAFVTFSRKQPKHDIIHSFCKIPYTDKPWFVTFEQALPRQNNALGNTFACNKARARLIKDNCQRIFCMSDYARSKFVAQNQGWDELPKALEKVEVLPPSLPAQATRPKTYDKNQPLKLIFIGSHMARKGGVVALRVVKKADKLGVPIRLHVISKKVCGPYTDADHMNLKNYTADLQLLEHKNVTWTSHTSNAEVLKLLKLSDFQIMPSLHDTYGFSILEGLAVGTPAITTNVCALPELIEDNKTGYLVKLPLDDFRNWAHKLYYFGDSRNVDYAQRRNTQTYWEILNQTYEQLADRCLESIIQFLDRSSDYERISTEAIEKVKKQHNCKRTGAYLDHLYQTASDSGGYTKSIAKELFLNRH